MASSTKQIIVCLTHNLKLYRSLQSTLEDLVVIHATKIDEVSQAVKHQQVEAIIVHLANAAGKIILEMLKTGHGNIPRYAILSPSYSKEKDLTALAQEYEVVAATKEEDGLKGLASLIMARMSGATFDYGIIAGFSMRPCSNADRIRAYGLVLDRMIREIFFEVRQVVAL